MSHFTVMVITETDDEKELHAALQPFHEYECTGIDDEYVVFVDHHDEIMEEWNTKTDTFYEKDGETFGRYDDEFYREITDAEKEKMGSFIGGSGWCGPAGISYSSRDWDDGQGYRAKAHMSDEEIAAAGYTAVEKPISEGGEYASPEEYAEEYHGYDKVRNGRIGRMTNPNAEWDWWQVGGRWSGKLMTKDGARVDEAVFSALDFDTPRKEAEEAAGERWDRAAEVIQDRVLIDFDVYREKHNSIDDAREAYWAQPVLVDLKAADWTDPFTEFKSYFVSREDYVRTAGENAIATFAFLGTDGEWKQRGDMGWWGMVSDEKDDWGTGFTDLLATVKPNQYVTIVDCHI